MATNTRASALADPSFFRQTGQTDSCFFAQMPSGFDTAHHVLVNRSPLAFFCSCQLRSRPCLHTQALLALYQLTPEIFEQHEILPEWAALLLAGKSTGMPANPQPNPVTSAAGKQKRFLERLERAKNGLENLEIWLYDLMRRGLATTVSEDPRFYAGIAARMSDASLPGLSRTLRLIGDIPATAPDWAEQVLAVLADIHLALRSFHRRETLPEPLLNDLQAFLGISQRKEDVFEHGEHLNDAWAVLGIREEQLEAQLHMRRQWLLGASGRFALLLDYAFGDTGFPPTFHTGDILKGTLAFYPSAFPMRALAAGELVPLPKKVQKLPGFQSFDAFQSAWIDALGALPWLSQMPAILNEVTPVFYNNRHWLSDAAGALLPLKNTDESAWRLLATASGQPISVFGEWDGRNFLAVSALKPEVAVLFAKD